MTALGVSAGRHRRAFAALALVLGATGLSAPARAVVVAPHAIFIDHRTRSAVLYIQNPDDVPAEIAIELQYGYPVSDSLGDVHIELIPEPAPGAPNAAPWVRALPSRMVVAPGARQAVRLLARPPAGLIDGEYWSRIIVSSRAAQTPVEATADGAVRVGLTLEMRTITSLTYRKGEVSTGLRLESFAAAMIADTVVTTLRLERNGNAAYLGKLTLTLEDGSGRKIDEWEQAIAVYTAIYRRLAFPVPGLPAGRYRVRLRISTDRDDISPDHILPAGTVERVHELQSP